MPLTWIFRQRLNTETYPKNLLYLGDGILLCPCLSGKIYKSNDYGLTWSEWSDVNPSGNDVCSTLAKLKNNSSFGITYGIGGNGYFYKTIDGGQNWSEKALGHLGGEGGDYFANDTLYFGNNVIGIARAYGIQRSIDYGESWSQINTGEDATFKSLFNLGDGIILATSKLSFSQIASIWRSTDYGENWTRVFQVDSKVPLGYRQCLIRMPDNSLLMTSDKVLCKSTDEGVNWSKISEISKSFAMIMNPSENILYAVTLDAYVLKSSDGGINWIGEGALDSHNSNNGVVHGATYTALGKINGAYIFDGDSDYIDIKNSINFGTSFSISFWLYIDTLKDYGDPFGYVYKITFFTCSDGHMTFSIGDGSSWGINASTPAGEINEGTWYHIIGTYDGSNTELFINNLSKANPPNTKNVGSISHLYIGARNDSDSPVYSVNGRVDEVGIWNVVLNPIQRSKLYNSGNGLSYDNFDLSMKANLVSYWKLDTKPERVGAETNGYFISKMTEQKFVANFTNARIYTTGFFDPSKPTDLLCNGETNPVDISPLNPKFSAIFHAPGLTTNQCQIWVNTASNFSGAEMWNSGKIDISEISDGQRCEDITYAGSSLSYNTKYYWKIVFYVSDIPSLDSDPANFTTIAFSAPVANFSAQPRSGKYPLQVHFTDLSE